MFGGFAARLRGRMGETGGRTGSIRRGRKRGSRNHSKRTWVEHLETRSLMAADAAPFIQGTVYRDADGNGVPGPGEALAGVTVQLLRDNGDGVLNLSSDTAVGQTLTDAQGLYAFHALDAGSRYFVVRPQQTVQGVVLPRVTSGLLAPGEPGAIIDQFATRQIVQALPPAPSQDSNSLAFPNEVEVIGGERDMSVRLQSGVGDLLLAVNPFGIEEVLLIDNAAGTLGQRALVWDGVDNQPDKIALGLNDRDLTQKGAFNGIVMRGGVDRSGSGTQVVLRLYEGRVDRFSEATIELPVTGGNALGFLFLPFSAFTGPVGADRVDAIEMRIEGGQEAADGKIAFLGLLGPQVFDIRDITEADLSITKTNGADALVPGQTTTYTIVARNNGPDALEGVRVNDLLPAELLNVRYTSVSSGGVTGATVSGTGAIRDVLSMGAGSSVTYTVVATVASNATGFVENRVEIVPPPGVFDPDPTNNTDTDRDPIGRSVDLAITKDDGRREVRVGEVLKYRITARNYGPIDVVGARITDFFPDTLENISYVSSGSTGVSGNTLSGTGDLNETVNIPAGGVVTYLVTATVGANAVGTVANLASIGVPDGIVDTDPTNNTQVDTNLVDRELADLSITKDDGLTVVSPGQELTYTLVVTNRGPSNVARVNVLDQFPANLRAIRYTSRVIGTVTGATASGLGNINDVVDMNAGSSIVYTVNAQVTPDATGSVVNTATVTSLMNDPNPGDNTATDVDILSPRADLSITKTNGVTSVRPGDTLTYTITVRNAGPSDVTQARVVDVFPGSLRNVTYTRLAAGMITTGSGSIDEKVDLAAGGTITYTVTGKLDEAAVDSVVNTASVQPPAGVTDPDPGNNQSTDVDSVIRSNVDIAVRKTADRLRGVPGEPVRYTVVVSNVGQAPVTTAQVVDEFPAQLTNVTYTSSVVGSASGNTPSGAGVLRDTLSLAPGASVVYSIQGLLASSATGSLQNVAQVTVVGQTDTNPGNNVDVNVLPLVPEADLSVVKSDGRERVEVGDTVRYTIVVRNAGPSDVAGVSVKDLVPVGLSGVTFTSTVTGNASGNTVSGQGAILDTVRLAAGSSITYQWSGRVTDAVSGVLANTATVSGPTNTGFVERDPTNNTSTDIDQLNSLVVLGSEPTVIRNDLLVEPAQTDRYQITAHMTGKMVIVAHFKHARGDLQLSVDDRNGNPIATVNTSTDDERIIIPVVSQEKYFVRVSGANGTVTNTYDLEIENFAAPIPEVVRLTPETDSGWQYDDAITRRSRPTIVVQADLVDFLQSGIPWRQPANADVDNQTLPAGPGMAVEVTVTSVATGATIVGYASAIGAPGQLFRFTPLENQTLLHGEYVASATVRIFDGATQGGQPAPATGRSPRSNPYWITIDVIAPRAADRIDLLDGSDSGSSFRDDVTSETAPAFQGTGEPNTKVRLYAYRIGGQPEIIGEGFVQTDGRWQVIANMLDDDIYHVRAEYEDIAGNISSIGEPLLVEVDTTPPNLPFLDLLKNSDTGTSTADEVTSDNTPAFSMTTEDPRQALHLIKFNYKFRIYLRPDAGDGGSPAAERLLYDSSKDATLPVANLLNGLTDLNQLVRTFGPLPDGVHNLKLEVEDRAGNISPDYLLTITVDTTPPPAELTLHPSSDSGTYASDCVTNQSSPAFFGASEVGATVYLYANGQSVGTATAGSDESDGVVGNGKGAWQVTSKPLADGEYRFTIRVQDLAGNESSSAEKKVWVDTRAPNIPLLDLLSDTGISDRDEVTRDNTPTITITAGATLPGGPNPFPNDVRYRIYDRPGDGTGEVLLIDSFGALRDLSTLGYFTETLPELADGVHNLKVEVEDRAGNLSHAFLLNVVVDTQPPALEGPLLAAASDSGKFGNDRVTRIDAPTFSGTSTPGDRVRVYANSVLVASGLVESDDSDGVVGNALGSWELTTNPLADGKYSIVVEAEDQAGNIRRSAAIEVIIDTVRPNIPLLDLLSDTGADTTDNITSITSPMVSITVNDTPSSTGNLFPNDILYRLYDRTGLAEEKLLLDSCELYGGLSAQGLFTHELANLGPGKHNLKLEAEDRAGNLSLPFLLEIFIDNESVAGTMDLAPYSDTGASGTDKVTNLQQPAVLGVGTIRDRVLVYADGSLVGEGVVHSDESDGVPGDGRGAWEVTLEPLRDGVHTLVARFEDEAGHSSTTPPLRIEVDTLAPNTPALDLLETLDSGRHNDDNISNAPKIAFTSTTTDPNQDLHRQLIPGGQNLKYRIFVRPEEGQETLVYDSSTDPALVDSLDGLVANLKITSSQLTLPEGLHNFKLEVEDRAGNLSTDFLMNVLLDRTAYLGTAMLDPSSSAGPTAPAGTTRSRSPVFTGTAEANALVTITIDGVPAGTTVATPFDGDDALQPPREPYALQGNWTISSKLQLTDGQHSVVVTYEDPAGNRAQSTTFTIVVDTKGPTITNVTTDEPGYPSLFDPKPTAGPDPLMRTIVLHVTDNPATGDAGSSVLESLATQVGLYRVVGDANGEIAVSKVTVERDTASGSNKVRLILHFAQPLPDDRFTLTVSDDLTDAAGNRLDGESNASAPFDGVGGSIGTPGVFPSGNGVAGGNFVARFTVDSRPEVGTWAAGSVWIDINGNTRFDTDNVDHVNRDIMYRFGFTSDDVFAGNFALPGKTTDGFDKLAVYGRHDGSFRWLVDTDNDGVPNIDREEPMAANGVPVAGNFDGSTENGDEVAVFDGRYWYLDTNHDFQTDTKIRSYMVGYPIVGDFDGDGTDDLATWADNRFMIDLATTRSGGWDGNADESFTFGFIGVRERPVAADMDRDGVDDLGLWVPDRTGVTDRTQGEWYFLISNSDSLLDRLSPPDDPIDYRPVIDFTPTPFGPDLYVRFGHEYALPIVGNFDPPTVPRTQPISFNSDNVLVLTNPQQPLDVNSDGAISPLDAMLVLNDLNQNGARKVTSKPEGTAYPDTNKDQHISPLDALLVLNELQQREVAARAAVAAVPVIPATDVRLQSDAWEELLDSVSASLVSDQTDKKKLSGSFADE